MEINYARLPPTHPGRILRLGMVGAPHPGPVPRPHAVRRVEYEGGTLALVVEPKRAASSTGCGGWSIPTSSSAPRASRGR